ncbi:MAG: hypothetical protein IPM24_22515 [Bryobacterales bacterium]|nr:hypothetical protein [Bryobacterales bacterium]
MIVRLWFLLACLAVGWADERPGSFLREDWKETPPETPVTQEHVANSDLELTLYGPGRDGIKKSHHDRPADDPYYVWSGTATGNWAVALRHRRAQVDLTGLSKVRWRSKQAGFRALRLIVKTAAGQWLISSEADPSSEDWREFEFILGNQRWRRLDIDRVIEGAWVDNPDLSRIDEIGFTDLMTGGGSAGCSRLDWIEVWGRTIPRGSVR